MARRDEGTEVWGSGVTGNASGEPPIARDPYPQEVLEAAVLRLMLIEHPERLSRTEILQVLNHPRDDRAVIEEAIRDLLEVGLAEREGEYLAPSRAAVRFDELPVD